MGGQTIMVVQGQVWLDTSSALFLNKLPYLLQPFVAVVILNYNGKNYLERFLPELLLTSYLNKKIYVADNASLDDSVSMLQTRFPEVELILLEKNYGFAGGYNAALKKIQAPYYVLLNSDVAVSPGWMEPIVRIMESDPAVGACQPKLRSFHQQDHFEYAGAAGGWIDFLGYPFARGRVFETIEPDNLQYNDPQTVFWASGAAMFVRGTVFWEMNGFDPFFFAHQEEIDLCWRMQLQGYRVMCCPESVVYHVGGGTLPKGHRKTFLNFRNNLIMLAKNLTFREKVWKMPLRILLDAIFAWKCLLSGDYKAYVAVLQAHFALFKWGFVKTTHQALKKKPMKNLSGVLPKCLIWEYFFRRNTRFSEIVDKKPQ